MTANRQNVFTQLGSEYYTFTSSEKKLADYILSQQDGVSHMSISDLARGCGVGDATVSRFCQRLGYKGYPEFKLAVANAVLVHSKETPLSGELSEEDTLEEIARKLLTYNSLAMSQTLEVLNPEAIMQAVELLHKAGSVFCMGQGGSMLLAAEAAHLFSTVSGKFRPVGDSHLQAIAAAMADEGDAILFFSYSGNTLDMLDTLKTAREQGVKVILITRFPNSPGAELADVVLQCGANENPLQSGSIPARIAQMYLLDIVFSEYSRRNMEETKERRSRVAKALAAKHK